MASNIQRQLNHLVRQGTVCTVKNKYSGWARIFCYEPLLDSVRKELADSSTSDPVQPWLDKDSCYVFEIGKNCGDVFSASIVESIEMTESGAIIHFKRGE